MLFYITHSYFFIQVETAANGNGKVSAYDGNETYQKLVAQNLKTSVAEALMKLFDASLLSEEDVDERAVEMLNGFPEEHAVYICTQLQV